MHTFARSSAYINCIPADSLLGEKPSAGGLVGSAKFLTSKILDEILGGGMGFLDIQLIFLNCRFHYVYTTYTPATLYSPLSLL